MTYLTEYINGLNKMYADNNQEKFKKYSDWFISNMVIFKGVNKKLSEKYSERSIIKRCYDNSYNIAKRSKTLEYVEGYTMSLIPIEHAFLTNKYNEVIDPTLAKLKINNKEYYGSEYIGIKIPLDILKTLRKSKEKYLPLPFLYWEHLNKQRFINGDRY